MLTILDRYVLRELVRPTLFGLFIFGSLWMVNLLIQTVNLFVTKGVELYAVVLIFFYSLPTVLVTAAPMASLLGALLAMSRLNADSEIIAAKGCGIGYVRLMMPVFGAGLAISVTSFVFNDLVVPRANAARETLFTNEVVLKRPLPKIAKDIFFDGGDQFRIFVRAFRAERQEMEDVTCYQFPKTGFPQVTEARFAKLEPGLWIFRDGRTFMYRKDGSLGHVLEFKEWVYPFQIKHATGRLGEGPKRANEMGFWELVEHIRTRRSQGLPTQSEEVDLWFKTAFPFANLFLILVGTPLASQSVRGGGGGVGMSIVLMFVYYVFMALGNALGDSGRFPPLLCAWAANLVMAAGAFVLIRRASR